MQTKIIIVFGFLLILLGLVGIFDSDLAFSHSRAVEHGLGPLRLEYQERKSIPLAPVLGCVVLLGGVALVGVGAKS